MIWSEGILANRQSSLLHGASRCVVPSIHQKDTEVGQAPGDFRVIGAESFFSDREVMQYYDCEALSSMDEAHSLIQRYSDWFEKQNGFRWGITLKTEANAIVGTCGLFAWHKSARIATLGYELSRAYWRRGIMSEAVRELLVYGYRDLNLNRIRATVVTDNVASARLLERLSFKKEGILRQSQFLNGKYDDLAAYALLREEWNA